MIDFIKLWRKDTVTVYNFVMQVKLKRNEALNFPLILTLLAIECSCYRSVAN